MSIFNKSLLLNACPIYKIFLDFQRKRQSYDPPSEDQDGLKSTNCQLLPHFSYCSTSKLKVKNELRTLCRKIIYSRLTLYSCFRAVLGELNKLKCFIARVNFEFFSVWRHVSLNAYSDEKTHFTLDDGKNFCAKNCKNVWQDLHKKVTPVDLAKHFWKSTTLAHLSLVAFTNAFLLRHNI